MYKEYSDSYLMKFTKKELISQLRCAEHNCKVAQQAYQNICNEVRKGKVDSGYVIMKGDTYYKGIGFDKQLRNARIYHSYNYMLKQKESLQSRSAEKLTVKRVTIVQHELNDAEEAER